MSVDGKQITGSPYSIKICGNYQALNKRKPTIVQLKDSGISSQPQEIAVGMNGVWAVVDDYQVHLFDSQNLLVKKNAIKPCTGDMRKCEGVAFDANNCLYVTNNQSVKKFDWSGNCFLQFRYA